MIYFELLKHEWRLVTRSFVWRRHWIVTVFLGLLVLYVVVSLVLLGLLWQELVSLVRRGQNPVLILNRNLITIFLALFTLRFFFQRPPKMRVLPYLHLPVSKAHLVTFFQIHSLATVHNLFPFLFFAPLWMRHIHRAGHEGGAWVWMAGIVIVLLLSHYLNTLMRSLVSRSREGFFIVLGMLMIAVFLDLAAGPGMLNAASAFVFDTLIQEQPIVLGLLGALVVVVYSSSTLLLSSDLTRKEERPSGRTVLWQVPFRDSRHRIWNLILLELKLMWRSERPKLYFLLSVVFGALYVAVPLLDAELLGLDVTRALVSLFASGIFAFNYGQLMFSWESSYFDGLLSRNLSLKDMVLSKLLILQGSCVVFFLLSLPFCLLLAPDILPMHAAFLFYNAGVSSVLILFLALHNRARIEVTNTAFFDFEGFSLLHWLWYIPTVVPPLLLLEAGGSRRDTALLVLAGVGFVSLLVSAGWASLFAGHLKTRLYVMAAGFRRIS